MTLFELAAETKSSAIGRFLVHLPFSQPLFKSLFLIERNWSGLRNETPTDLRKAAVPILLIGTINLVWLTPIRLR